MNRLIEKDIQGNLGIEGHPLGTAPRGAGHYGRTVEKVVRRTLEADGVRGHRDDSGRD